MRATAIAIVLGLATAAHAEVGGPAPAGPKPRQASGIAVDDPEPIGARLRWIPRALLFVPRWAVWTVAQPIRLAAWASERYQVQARVKGALFNVDETYGVYPAGSYSSDFGIVGGLRFVHRDLFGAGEDVKLRADFGGRYRQAYGFSLRSGERFGDRVTAGIDARYERRPNERFFGIGNADEEAVPVMPIGPDAAIATRFREDLVRVVGTLDARVLGSLTARLSGALMLRDFATAGEDGLATSYDPNQLVGWTGVDNVYLETELVYDTRRPTSTYQSQAIDATGWLAAAHVGRAAGIGGDRSAFTRYGGELQRFFDLYGGSRVLALRVLVESVAARADRLPFIDLPRLGGNEYLRGYPEGRFRDRAIGLATAEYTWDLGNFLAAYTFVDVGRAWPSLGELELANLRAGFGGGVQIHTRNSFITRAQLAVSRDGDVFVELALTPAFGRRERAGRY